jgi:hemerythrin-like domain-containing protein
MKYASEDLINEHEGILLGLKILEKIVDLVKAGNKIKIEDLKEMINFFRLFADKCHHGNEMEFTLPFIV